MRSRFSIRRLGGAAATLAADDADRDYRSVLEQCLRTIRGFARNERRRTDGGEALPVDESIAISGTTRDSSTCPGNANWFALWTHPHCEPLVESQLAAKGFCTLLPMISVWSRRAGNRHLIRIPMFPSYLFLRHVMDKHSYIEIVKTRGLTRILGDGWDRLAVVGDADIEAIQGVMRAEVPVLPHPYLREGQRVRITHGPLADIKGILVHSKPNKGHLVLSIELLQRSVAVEVDCTQVAPIGPHLPLC